MSSTKPEGVVWDSKLKAQYESKRPGEYMDPCQDAASKSMKCLHRNGGDKEMCTDYFHNIQEHIETAKSNGAHHSMLFSSFKEHDTNYVLKLKEMKELKRKEAKPWFKFS
ncbi:Cytochrome c oxidase-assembly factor COX23, mitochondrial [Golovinomyces cichoracearum]|uniref:Cytochrome c oxidase-assembly factor COX23, mitochondrial n=1 Tax=Golovinomyces cichoracearum TaxID=62708 RepID=A0A420ITT8_9PEZI|nr:Cytochrome c oxidase-assembly factor COX23, mitochondrial [Golovinomyces cichoracearum]